MEIVPDREIYPFSLVLGPNFRPNPDYGNLNDGDREVRGRLHSLLGASNSQLLGRLVGIFADGQIRFEDIPEIEPHIRQGVTFKDPAKLYSEWETRADVGPGLGEAMRRLIVSATTPDTEEA